MIKKIFILLLSLILTGCFKGDELTFIGTVLEIHENSILVSTSDPNIGFDLASVSYNFELDQNLSINQDVEITIKPEIKETYPVLVVATKIKIKEPSYIKITPNEARTMMDEEEVVILDVRTKEEYDQGHIPNAILIPDTEIKTNAAAMLTDKDKKILVYCRSGNRSKSASKMLISLGYTKVLDFGGINDWEYDIVK